MKQLIRRFSRVADSSGYVSLRSDSAATSKIRRSDGRRLKSGRSGGSRVGAVPEGHIPVYVGEEMERFVVSAEFLNHPIFVELLKKSAQEYGYEQQGVLRIPCSVFVFERVLQMLADEGECEAVEEIARLVSQEFV